MSSRLPLRHPRVWLAVGWGLVALAILASLLPAQELPSVGGGDKLHHAAAYMVLSLWFSGIYPKSRYVHIGVGLFLLGIAIEWAQGAMHYDRESDPYDVLANALGVVAGLLAAHFGLGGWAARVERVILKT